MIQDYDRLDSDNPHNPYIYIYILKSICILYFIYLYFSIGTSHSMSVSTTPRSCTGGSDVDEPHSGEAL